MVSAGLFLSCSGNGTILSSNLAEKNYQEKNTKIILFLCSCFLTSGYINKEHFLDFWPTFYFTLCQCCGAGPFFVRSRSISLRGRSGSGSIL
jgi:hypothetical protein